MPDQNQNPNGSIPLRQPPLTPQDISAPRTNVPQPEPQVIQPEFIPVVPKIPKEPNRGLRDFGSFVGVLATAGILAFLLISFVFRSYEVDGISMQTTLMNQDKLLIWKMPRTIARITGNPYLPARGDVVIFDQIDLTACGQGEARQLIKRVIALPGEKVSIVDGHYMVYNASYPQGFDPDKTLGYDQDGHIPTTTVTAETTDFTVGKNQVFVSGDNRPFSCDSRAFGPINENQLIGKLIIRLLPANKIKLF